MSENKQLILFFNYEFKKATNLVKLYLLITIHKGLSNVIWRPAISVCETLVEKASEFLDYQMKLVMQQGKSYIQATLSTKSKTCRIFLRVQSW